jgi:cytochrome P450
VGQELTDDELIDIVLNFIIAGRDTTASALAWSTLRLLRAPAVARKMESEVSAAVAGTEAEAAAEGGGSGQLQELPHVAAFNVVHRQLPYTRAVVSEALRLHPSVPKDGKYARADDTLPDGTRVSRGCFMLWCNYALGRDPTLWPQVSCDTTGSGRDGQGLREKGGGGGRVYATSLARAFSPLLALAMRRCCQPLEFRPERWLEKSDEDGPGGAGGLWRPTTQVSDYVYPVFNAGPRLCLGRPLAYLEMVMMLATVFGRYELCEARHHTEEYNNSLVAPMKHGLHVKLTRK